MVITTEGLQFLCELFAVKIDNIIYCSLVSFDSARTICFSSYLKSGVWTEEQYHAAYTELFKQYGKLTRKVSYDSNEKNPTKTVISGTLQWVDDYDQTHPLQYVAVEIWDSLRSQKLTTVTTNSLGFYSFSFYDTLPHRTYRIRVYPGGDYANTQDIYGEGYFYQSDPEPKVLLGSSVNFSVVFPMNSDMNKAFQISQAVITAARYYEAMEGTSLPKVDIIYPYSREDYDATFFYLPDRVNIKDRLSPYSNQPSSYASWDAIMHEYGHHVAKYMDIENNPGGNHYFELNQAEGLRNKDKGMRLAWGEAYPSIFALLAQNYYSSSLNSIFTVGDTIYTPSDAPKCNLESIAYVFGDGCEGAVAGVLWDLFDNSSTETHDTISMGHSSFWSLVTDSGAVTMFDFVCHFMSTQSISAQRKLSVLLSYYMIAPFYLDYEVTASTASFSWKAGGTSPVDYLNNSFDLVFCNADQEEVFRIEYLSFYEPPSKPPANCQYTLTAAEYATIKNACGNTFGFYVVAFQTDAPATGLYESEYITVSIPN